MLATGMAFATGEDHITGRLRGGGEVAAPPGTCEDPGREATRRHDPEALVAMARAFAMFSIWSVNAA